MTAPLSPLYKELGDDGHRQAPDPTTRLVTLTFLLTADDHESAVESIIEAIPDDADDYSVGQVTYRLDAQRKGRAA